MGDFWCPVGGRCAGCDCEVDDAGGRCETHGCPLISTTVLHAIRDEVRRPQLQAVANWKVRYGELQEQLRMAKKDVEAETSLRQHFERQLGGLDAEAAAMVDAVIADEVGAWDCVCSPNPFHEGHCPVPLRNEVKTVFDEVALLRHRLAEAGLAHDWEKQDTANGN